jgi:predicted acylesterase/phospholipase RssA
MPADIRYWGDDPLRGLREWGDLSDVQLDACCRAIMDRTHAYLLISSGGDRGAFGAGVLVGWTRTGTRPEFQLVTGVSTGAIIAVFAFLGPDYDDALRDVYTTHSTRDLAAVRGVRDALSGGAVYDSTPFRHLIDRYLGDDEIAKIAAEGHKGRRLLIGTTNLDAARPVVWDLTRIAASGAPNARALIGDLVLASSSIPGIFPPVLLDVEAAGRRYDELHVDGGVTSQLFLDHGGLDWKHIAERLRVAGKPQVYVIHNGRARPHLTAVRSSVYGMSRDAEEPQSAWKEVEPRVSPVLARSLSSLLRTRGMGEAVQLYTQSHSDDLGFNLASIPDDFAHDSDELFDREYMRALFERGYALAQSPAPWTRVAPR